MADEKPITQVAASAVVETPSSVPAIPASDRQSVPASAVFDEEDGKPATTETPEAGEPAGAVADGKPATTETPEAGKPAGAVADGKPATTETPEAGKPAPTPPAAPAKVKIGGKEYSVEELEALITNPPKPAEAKPTSPEIPATAAPTPEQIAKQENEWGSNFLKENKLGIAFTKEEMESIIEGGEEGAKVLSDKINSNLARVALMTRKSMFDDLNPYFDAANAALQPLLEQQVQFEKIATEQVFVTRHPEFVESIDQARRVADALVAQYPEQVSKMTKVQFVDEVARQTDLVMQNDYLRFNPGAKDNWKDAIKARKAAAPSAPSAPAAPAAPAAPSAPAAPAAPAIRPPAHNSPAATSTAGSGLTPDAAWHKQIAASLAD